MTAFLYSYLICKHLLTDTGFLQQPAAPWGLCQEESDVHSRSFFPLNTGIYLDLFFMFPQHTPLPSPGYQGSAPHPRDTEGWVILWWLWLLMALGQMVLHNPSSPQGGESHSHPRRQGSQCHPDQDQAGPTCPRPCVPRALGGQGLYQWKIASFSFSFLLQGWKGKGKAVSVWHFHKDRQLILQSSYLYLCFLRTVYQMKEICHAFSSEHLLQLVLQWLQPSETLVHHCNCEQMF